MSDVTLVVAAPVPVTVLAAGVGLQGPRGATGSAGAPGPAYTGDNLPDMTLIFENALI